jgi:hypothetical protein
MREHIKPLDKKPKGKFGESPGRPLGALNKITADLKRAMLDGAVTCDYAFDDPNNKDAPGSITTYMRNIANKFPELYFQAIVRLIPKEVRTHLQNDTTLDITYRTMDQVRDAMLAEGMTPKLISDIEKMLPVPIHHEEEPAVDEEVHDDVELLDRSRA